MMNMALQKVNYIDDETVISAKNLNDIQDSIATLESRTINGKPLSADVSLSAGDVGAAAHNEGLPYGKFTINADNVDNATEQGIYYTDWNPWAQTIVFNNGHGAIQLQFDWDGNLRHRMYWGTYWHAWHDLNVQNFAPAGYGLGGNAATLYGSALDITASGWYYYTQAQGFSTDVPSYEGLILASVGPYSTRLDAFPLSGSTQAGCHATLTKNWHTWDEEWEWENPPMETGVAYRTTERAFGKAIYKRVNEYGEIGFRLEGSQQEKDDTWEYGPIGGAIYGPFRHHGYFYIDNNEVLQLGYIDPLKTTNGEFASMVLLLSSNFYRNMHGSSHIVHIRADDSGSDGNMNIAVSVGMNTTYNSPRTFYYKYDADAGRLYLYVLASGGNGFGRWNVTALQDSGNIRWNPEFVESPSLDGLIEVN